MSLECGAYERFLTSHDLAAPMCEEVKERKLRTKARGLLGELEAEILWAAVSDLDACSAGDLAKLLTFPSSARLGPNSRLIQSLCSPNDGTAPKLSAPAMTPGASISISLLPSRP